MASEQRKRDLGQVASSPTGLTPPHARPRLDAGDFTAMLVSALGDPRVAEALNVILVQPLERQLKAKDLEIRELKDEVASLKTDVDQLKYAAEEVVALKCDVNQLKDAADELEQYGRRNAVRIWSKAMPEHPGEDTDKLVLEYAEKVGVDLPPEYIGRSHRVGRPAPGKTRPIIVKFTTYNMRRKVFDARKNCQDVYVSEDLTRLRSSILYKSRLERNYGRFQHCWSSDGRINVRLPDNSKHVITTLAQLDRLIDENPLPE